MKLMSVNVIGLTLENLNLDLNLNSDLILIQS